MNHRWPKGPAGLALLTLLLCFVASAAQAGAWTNLWSTREQQAQHLLDSKNPAAAAPLFSDARRRAYAEMEAGQYAKAAKSLEPFKDADSEYNRGNALAHSGQLREALSAYDAALTAAPGDKDVIHNRDLVRRALERQQQNQSGKQGDPNGRSGSQGSQGGQSQGGSHSPGGSQQKPGNPSQNGNQGGGQSQAGNQQRGSQPQSGNQPQSAQSQAGQSQGSQNQRGDQAQSNTQSQAANQTGGQSQPGNQHPGSQPQNGSQSQSGSQPQGAQSQGGQSQGSQDQSGAQSQANAQPQANSQSQANAQSQANNPSQAANPPQAGAQPPAQAATQTPSGAPRPGDNPSGEGALSANGQQTNGSTAAAGLNAENAQQDAEAALRYRQAQEGRAPPGSNDTGRATVLGPDGKIRSSADVPPPKPPSEQSLALDQWLRGIPEDSGELLRRKFLIEHRLRQQANEQ